MALAILPAIIVSLVILVVLFGTYYVYQAYRRVRFAIPDVERARHIENGEDSKQATQLHDAERPLQQYQSGQWYSPESVVPAHIAPAAKALPRIPEIEYTGSEELVSPPERIFLSSAYVKRSKGRTDDLDNYQAQDLHAGMPWNFATDGYRSSLTEKPALISPKPVRIVMRNLKTEPAKTAYDSAQTTAANIWDKINKGELQPSRRRPEKSLPKSPNAPTQEVLRDPTEFENDVLQDIDLRSSIREWAKTNVSVAYVTKCSVKPESFDSMITAIDANKVNIERPVPYVKRKPSSDTTAVKPEQPPDRAAETRRKMQEAREQMEERKKHEEEERQAEERRQAEEQVQRGEEQRQGDEERLHSFAQVAKAENDDPLHTRDFEAPIQSTRRRSNTSTASKRELKSRERPLACSPRRANTFANDATASADNAMTNKKPGGSGKGEPRSMSMDDQTRPDFNAMILSAAEDAYADNSERMRDPGNSQTREAANPVSGRIAECWDGSASTSTSSGYSPRNSNGRPISEDAAENSSTSVEDAKVSFASAQKSPDVSSNEIRPQVQRRSNASSNDSRLSSEGARGSNYFERNNSKSSSQSRASAHSQSSRQSATDREKPERKSSLAHRALSKLGRKSSASEKKRERGSASSTQSWDCDGTGLRGGGRVFVAEPEEMSGSEDEHGDGHGDWGWQEEEDAWWCGGEDGGVGVRK